MLRLILTLQFAADEIDSFESVTEDTQDWSPMPCVVSGFGTDFKKYVLEHDMTIVREDNLDYLTNRSG